MKFYWNRFLETRILKSTGSGPEKRGTKMESSRTGNGPEYHDMALFALKLNLDLNRSLFFTVTLFTIFRGGRKMLCGSLNPGLDLKVNQGRGLGTHLLGTGRSQTVQILTNTI